MPDMEKVTYGLRCLCYGDTECKECPYAKDGSGWYGCRSSCAEDAIDLLKEQEEQKRRWLQNIADNQLANAPTKGEYDFMPLEEHMKERYQRGIYDGLQMAYEIICADGERGDTE